VPVSNMKGGRLVDDDVVKDQQKAKKKKLKEALKRAGY
jgi:hypothetical protein